MTLILRNRLHKAQAISLLQHVLEQLLLPCKAAAAEPVIEHLNWMRRQSPDLNINCKLETVPELQITRITIEASFESIPEKTR